ncbi:hypothetical protein TELCIR_23655, partial [Teladorsagia circumcincta]
MTSNIRPTQSNIIRSSELKTTTKTEEKEALKEIINERAQMFGARNLKLLNDSKKGGSGKSAPKAATSSMADFIKSQAGTSNGGALHAPKLGYGLCGEKNINLGVTSLRGRSVSTNDPARLRAISILKRTKEQSTVESKSAKRQREDSSETASPKRSRLTPLDNKVDLDALLKKKSMHDSQANKAQGLMAQKHLDTLEAKEKVETFVTSCMSVKDVKVVS